MPTSNDAASRLTTLSGISAFPQDVLPLPLTFEILSRYRHFARAHVRHASWDLRQVHLVDPHAGKPSLIEAPTTEPACGMAPLLQKILRQYATTGMPPAYLPKDDLPPVPPSHE